MNKRKIAALLGVFTLLACTAAATRDKTIQPPKDSRAQRAAQEYAETTALRAEDEGRYKVLKKKLENVTKKLAKEKNVPEDRLSRKEKLEQNVRQREMILKEWEKHQDELLQNGRGAANANPAKKTPASAELEELEKRTEKLYRKLQRKVYRLYSSTNKPGDEMDEVVALNEKVNRCREKLKEAAEEYAAAYLRDMAEQDKVDFTDSLELETLAEGGFIDLEGKSPRTLSREEAAEKTAAFLLEMDEGKYPDIDDKYIRAAGRLRAKLGTELQELGYFEDEAAQAQARNQEAWESSVKEVRRFNLNGELRLDYKNDNGDVSNDKRLRLRNRLYGDYNIDGNWHAVAMVESEKNLSGSGDDHWLRLERYYLTGNVGAVRATAGKMGATMAEGNVYDSSFKGVMLEGGDKINFAARYGSVNSARNVATFTAGYAVPGKYSLEAGYFGFGMNGGGRRNIYMLNGHVPLGRHFDFGAMFLMGRDSYVGNGNGYVLTLQHGTPWSEEPGRTSYYLKYYHQPRATYVQHTMNGVADRMNGFKGWGIGVTRTLVKNLMATLEFDHLKEMTTNRINNTVWLALSFFYHS